MDKRVVSQKINNLINCLNRLDARKPKSADELESNYDLQDIVSINLERAVQICIDVAAHLLGDYDDSKGLTSASLFSELAAKGIIKVDVAEKVAKAVGFRNILVHRDADIDWQRVHGYVNTQLSTFRAFIVEVSTFCGL